MLCSLANPCVMILFPLNSSVTGISALNANKIDDSLSLNYPCMFPISFYFIFRILNTHFQHERKNIDKMYDEICPNLIFHLNEV